MDNEMIDVKQLQKQLEEQGFHDVSKMLEAARKKSEIMKKMASSQSTTNESDNKFKIN
jgi:hypothetical protein